MKSTLVLAAVAGLLLAFILIFERGTISTGEVERRGGAVLAKFVRKRVTKIEIQRHGETTVLERVPDPENDLDFGIWKLVSPLQGDADEQAVEVLLGELEWMDNRRRLDGVSSSDRARFGLDTPRYRLWYTVGSQRMLMRVGSDTPRGDAVYMEGDRQGSVFVVGKDLPEALNHDPGHYYTKVMHDGVMLLSTLRLTLRTDAGELKVEKIDNHFRLSAPIRGLVSRTALSESIKALDTITATRFISATIDDPRKYGFDAPVMEAIVQKRTLVGEPLGVDSVFEKTTRRFRLGAACGSHSGESYFVVDDDGPVMCVMDAELGAVSVGLERMREKRLLNLDDDQIAAVHLTSGKRKLVLTHDLEADTWRYSVEGGGSGPAAPTGDAESSAVTEWLTLLRSEQAQAFEQGSAEGPLAASGVSVHFDREGENHPDYDIAVSRGGEPDVLVRRADEPSLVRFGASARHLLQPPTAHFFKRKLLSEKAGALSSLELRRGATSERVTRGKDGEFEIESPLAVAADRVVLQELSRLIAGLEAVRFVADSAEPHHGLGTPAITVRARFDGGSPIVLRLGAEVEGGRFATLGDAPAVFVASRALVQRLSAPLASRTAIATGREELQSVIVKGSGGAACGAKRSGDGFEATGGSLGRAGAEALVRALSVLRAADASFYGPPRASEGMDPPTAVLTITTTGGAVHELRIGATVEDTDRPRVYIRRSGLDVSYVLGADMAATLSSCKTASP